MEAIKTLAVAGMIVAVCLLCFAGVMQVEQATAQNIQAIYLDLHK